ncbi:RNA polymerase sigma factor [Gaoshiqia sp. Z1-71]|uniref:RNA polymerase sigma factor n=1 Tax=Gaoshiqia hydrogeniformans TaxID=3290090 RepID=UPI003BF88E9E
MAEKDLQKLIDGCRKHDRQSQKLLYQRLYGFAMKICLRFAENRDEASEILNEGFFKVFTNIEKYDDQWPFKAWLGKIIYHASIDYYRANLKWSQMGRLEKTDDVLHQATIEHKLEYDDLLAIVQRLPPAYRIVFNLYAVDGYSHDEIAQMVGISAGTSRSNLHKARQKLQQMLSRPYSLIMLLISKNRAKSGKDGVLGRKFCAKWGKHG